MNEGNGSDIEVEVEATTEVVIYGVKGDVEDLSGRWTGVGSWGEEWLPLATEADGHGAFGAAEAFAQYDVFDNYAKGCKIEEAIKGSAKGAVSMVENVRCVR